MPRRTAISTLRNWGSGQQYDEGSIPSIVDVNFTANMEALLDGVEEGTVKWKTIVSNFYPDLDEAVKKRRRTWQR